MKLSLAKVRQLLPPGVRYTREFTGKNRQFCAPGNEIATLEATSNSNHQMISRILTGPKQGSLTYLTWAGVRAEVKGESIHLADKDGAEFLKITLAPVEAEVP